MSDYNAADSSNADNTPDARVFEFSAADTVNHVLSLLESQGQAAVGVARNILRLLAAFTSRDMPQVFSLLNQGYVDISALISAIKAEFGI